MLKLLQNYITLFQRTPETGHVKDLTPTDMLQAELVPVFSDDYFQTPII